MTDEDVWLLSYYRSSELQGAMLFGRLCRELRDPAIQRDMTGHFADEARHAFLWTRCLDRMGAAPVPVERVYQDGYLEACGVPASMVEILALTQVFELRVLSHYEAHRALPDVRPEIRSVLDVLLADERGHVAWVRNALDAQASRHGRAAIDRAVARCEAADREVFARALAEHGDRIGALGACPGNPRDRLSGGDDPSAALPVALKSSRRSDYAPVLGLRSPCIQAAGAPKSDEMDYRDTLPATAGVR